VNNTTVVYSVRVDLASDQAAKLAGCGVLGAIEETIRYKLYLLGIEGVVTPLPVQDVRKPTN
jgi:hypothetical protein